MSQVISHSPGQQVAQKDVKQYRRLMVVAVTLFFVVAAVTRLLHLGTHPAASDTGKRETIYQEAKRTASTVMPYAFMS